MIFKVYWCVVPNCVWFSMQIGKTTQKNPITQHVLCKYPEENFWSRFAPAKETKIKICYAQDEKLESLHMQKVCLRQLFFIIVMLGYVPKGGHMLHNIRCEIYGWLCLECNTTKEQKSIFSKRITLADVWCERVVAYAIFCSWQSFQSEAARITLMRLHSMWWSIWLFAHILNVQLNFWAEKYICTCFENKKTYFCAK